MVLFHTKKCANFYETLSEQYKVTGKGNEFGEEETGVQYLTLFSLGRLGLIQSSLYLNFPLP